MEQLC